MSDVRNVFHEHLDVCQQCEQHPFALCREGERLLRQAVSDLSPTRIPPRKGEKPKEEKNRGR